MMGFLYFWAGWNSMGYMKICLEDVCFVEFDTRDDNPFRMNLLT